MTIHLYRSTVPSRILSLALWRKRIGKCRIAILCVIAILDPEFSNNAIADEIPREQFLSEYRSALNTLQELGKHVQIEGVAHEATKVQKPIQPTKDQKVPPTRDRETTYAYFSSDGNKKLILSRRDRTGYFERVVVEGKTQEFVLRRASENDPLYLEKNSLNDPYRKLLDTFESRVVCAAYSIDRVLLPEIVGSPEFIVKQAVRSDHHGESLVKADFEYQHSKSNVMTGWMMLDPSRNWVLREFEVLMTSSPEPSHRIDIQVQGNVHYTEEAGAIRPEEVTIVQSMSNNMENEFKFKTSKWNHKPTSAESFTLAAYNLGDSYQPTSDPRSIFLYWVLGIAAIAFVLSLILRLLGRSH